MLGSHVKTSRGFLVLVQMVVRNCRRSLFVRFKGMTRLGDVLDEVVGSMVSTDGLELIYHHNISLLFLLQVGYTVTPLYQPITLH